MYYEINVSFNGNHFFATAERSLTDRTHAKKALAIFMVKFPVKDGYSITISYNERNSQSWDAKSFLAL